MDVPVPSTSAPWHWRPGTLSIPIRPAWRRRLRIGAICAAVAVVLYALLGFVAVPWFAKRQIESLAPAELGRRATVGEVRFNPFTLRARISNFELADKEPGKTLLAFELLDVNATWDSLWKRALMVEQLKLVRPHVRFALDAAGRSNVQDLMERPASRRSGGSGGSGGESPFAVNNLVVEDGTVSFDDAVRGHKTEVTKLSVALPFLSDRSSDATVRVKPHVSASVDGAPFALEGTTSSPFEDLQRATLALDFDALPLPRYVEYAPLPNGLRLTDGALTTRLTLSFLTWKGKPRGIMLAGMASLDRLAIARADGSPLTAVKRVEVHLHRLDPLARKIEFDRVAVSAPELDVRRLADGSLELPGLATPAKATAANETGGDSEAAPWSWSVDEATLSDGRVQWSDRSVTPAYATTITALTLAAAKVASQGAPGTIEASFETQDGARFSSHVSVDVAARAARGHVALQSLALAPLHPYYDPALALDVRRGSLDVAGDFDAAAGTPARFTLAGGSIVLAGLDTALPGEREALVRMARLEVAGIALDLAARKVTIESIDVNDEAVRLRREADGRMNFERAIPSSAPWHAGAGAQAVAGAQWQAVVQRLRVQGLGVDFEDGAVQPAAKVRVTQARLAVENIDSTPGTKANVDFAARIGTRGRIAIKGTTSAQPLGADAIVEASALELVPFQAYVASRANVVLTSGTVDARGHLVYANGTDGAAVRYAGNVSVNDFASMDLAGSQELARWKTLAVTEANVDTAPFRAAIGGIALDGFYARLILDAGGKLNIGQLSAPAAGATPATAPTPPPPPASAATPAAAAPRDIPVSIGRVQLGDGEIEYSDFFVKPNYSAHLTEVNGTLSRLAAGEQGTIDVTAHVNHAAPVEIRGTADPFAQQLRLDLRAKATGVDLPPVSTYSIKYAGYGIEKGKLSMEVHYRVQDRKLSATNKLRLDQLTFGAHVDSPTATKLPVLFLVSLLQDRNGVIALDVPIGGTLDDPKFSIWGIVVQVIGNLLTKAATAPFALLGGGGSGGEQLSFVEFEPGQAAITPAAETKLASLAKVLDDRPQLKLDAGGRAIPDVDTEGLRRAYLDNALRAAKQKDLARSKGESAPALAGIAIGPEDRTKYMKAVYSDTKLPNKPRNFIGIAKDIPPEEMEKLLLAGYSVDDSALRELADARAATVKEWLATKGGIPAERMFIVAPKIGRDGLKGEGAATRVDFGIR
jgi:uncharacterized protein involved in outer membrane biogenesis